MKISGKLDMKCFYCETELPVYYSGDLDFLLNLGCQCPSCYEANELDHPVVKGLTILSQKGSKMKCHIGPPQDSLSGVMI